MDESIFTEEQIEELNEISQLSEEDQKRLLPDFLKKLSPEQLDSLKQSQPGQCPYCLIAEGKIKAKKLYEDNDIIAVLEINPISFGHTIVFPKKHFQILAQISDAGKLFNIVNKLSSVLFENLKAQGTNILVSNGSVAGQMIHHVVVDIIPRYENDKINFNLTRKKTSEEELENTFAKIKSKQIAEKPVKKIQQISKEEIKPKIEKKEQLKFKKERIP